ncbi:hypothetical protein SAMN05216228_10418 [Rhizobium tibeticum]|uniref:Uncharacterized protein n=2 Tax=Rhizobium tibeticum TaxID=501024 RepID=A0A1H8VBX9_9HYPH|nr:hypothetical protein RTCCBAU85039_6002 [Rhizobium tibeticum]SEP12753.1 hypothetical protein SAMN05216228_10418 [Rhizobium tibeticum]
MGMAATAIFVEHKSVCILGGLLETKGVDSPYGMMWVSDILRTQCPASVVAMPEYGN